MAHFTKRINFNWNTWKRDWDGTLAEVVFIISTDLMFKIGVAKDTYHLQHYKNAGEGLLLYSTAENLPVFCLTPTPYSQRGENYHINF
jgi:hypothetical protein